MKKYRINTAKSEIESFVFVCDHPENKGYIIVLDEYKMPQRIARETWEKMTIVDYNEAKLALIEHLKDIIVFYSKAITN